MKNPDVERYLAGTLDEDRSLLLERHLQTCLQCSDEVAEFHEFQRIVDTVLNGPPPNGPNLVLQRALRQIRTESAAKRRRRGAFLASAAAVVVGVALTTGVAVGRSGDSVNRRARAQATDAGTGTALAVSFTETSGWSHISAAVEPGCNRKPVRVGADRRLVTGGRPSPPGGK